MKDNYKGNRNLIDKPSYLFYCYAKCGLVLSNLTKKIMLGTYLRRGAPNRGLKNIIIKYDHNGIPIIKFSNKREWYGRNNKYHKVIKIN